MENFIVCTVLESSELATMTSFNQWIVSVVSICVIKMCHKLDYVDDLTAQKMEFSIKDFFSKFDQIRSFLRIWSHLLRESLIENFIFCVVLVK